MLGKCGLEVRNFLVPIAAAAVLSWVGAVEAQTLELKLQLYQGPQHLIVQKVKAISPEVEKMTEGRVKISVFDSGTLAKGPQMFDAVEKGVVDIAAWSYAFASPKNMPFLMLGTFPFVYRDAAGYINAWKDESLVGLANDYIRELGYRRVEIGNTFYVGFYQMGFKDKEPRSPADLRGLRVRSLGSVMPFFTRYGISAVSVDTPSVYEGLERGIIDGAIGVYSNWVDWGWGEPATYLVDFNLAAVGLAFLVNKDSVSKLRPADRAIVGSYLARLQDALNEEYLKADQTYRQVISADLMSVYTPTAAELREWSDARAEIRDDWVKQVGDRGARALSIVEKYNGELTYKKSGSR